MRVYFKPKVTVVCLLLVALFCRLSYWQWTRHLEKKAFLVQLDKRLREDPTPLRDLAKRDDVDWGDLINRRVLVEGDYDYSHELVLRNRQNNGEPGVHVITPLKISGTDIGVLINRGFVPLSYSMPEARGKLKRDPHESFTGLIKETSRRKFLAPSDPEPNMGSKWVDAWLRVDVENIQKQIPYMILPIYLEKIPGDLKELEEASLIQTKSDRDEMFMPGERMFNMVHTRTSRPPTDYPTPAFDLVLPPGRHLGYVFEWALMGLFTALIGLVIQLRPSWSWKKAQ